MTIADDLLKRVDDAANKEGVSRSRFLSRAAAQTLGDEIGPGASPNVREAIEGLRELFRRNGFAGDSTAAVRAERDSRDSIAQRW